MGERLFSKSLTYSPFLLDKALIFLTCHECLVAGIPVRVYNIPKTIADCFKYRSTIGLDVALEALKEAWVARKLDLNLLAHYAQICRVQKVIQPYLEMLVL